MTLEEELLQQREIIQRIEKLIEQWSFILEGLRTVETIMEKRCQQ